MSIIDRAKEKVRDPRVIPPDVDVRMRARFETKVAPATDLSPNGMAGCILWTAAKTGVGYGSIWNGNGGWSSARAVAWALAGRTVPEGHELDHLCRRTHCVNVEHLEAVTKTENLRRGKSTKLTREQASEIRYLRNAGWNRGAIAEAYGVRPNQVYLIATGKSWADL